MTRNQRIGQGDERASVLPSVLSEEPRAGAGHRRAIDRLGGEAPRDRVRETARVSLRRLARQRRPVNDDANPVGRRPCLRRPSRRP